MKKYVNDSYVVQSLLDDKQLFHDKDLNSVQKFVDVDDQSKYFDTKCTWQRKSVVYVYLGIYVLNIMFIIKFCFGLCINVCVGYF